MVNLSLVDNASAKRAFPTGGAEGRRSEAFDAFLAAHIRGRQCPESGKPEKFFVALINFEQTSAATSIRLAGR
jgi:hypothetical protein